MGETRQRASSPIAQLANGFDVKWVMSQVGHADSKMTLGVYAQLEQRVERSHGTAFDELVRNADAGAKPGHQPGNRHYTTFRSDAIARTVARARCSRVSVSGS